MRSVRVWFRSTTGGLPANFWYLWAGSLINRLGSFVLIFLAIYLTSGRGFSESQAGLVLGLWGAGGAVGTIVGGVLVDRWGRRPTLLAAHLGAAALMLALGLARELALVAACALLLGFFAESARPAFGAMMIDVVPPRDRVRAFSLNYWAINLGFACSAVLAGFAAEVNHLLLFLVNAGTILITALVVFVKVGETRADRTGALGTVPDTPGAPSGGLRTVLADRVYLGFIALTTLLAMIFMQHLSMLPIAMEQDGLSPATFGTVIALNGVLIVSGQLFVPRLIRGRSRSHVLALAALITGAGFGLTAFADATWFYALTVLIWTLGEMLHAPSGSTLIAELSPDALRGRYQGLFSLSWSLAGFTAPILGGLVRQSAGNAALWLGCAALAALIAVAHLVSGPARERRAALLARSATPSGGDRSQPGRPGADDKQAVGDGRARPEPAGAGRPTKR